MSASLRCALHRDSNGGRAEQSLAYADHREAGFGRPEVGANFELAMGLIAEFFAFKSGLPASWRLFLTTGILGGFSQVLPESLDNAAAVLRSSA